MLYIDIKWNMQVRLKNSLVWRNYIVQYCEEILTQAMNDLWLNDFRAPHQLIKVIF